MKKIEENIKKMNKELNLLYKKRDKAEIILSAAGRDFENLQEEVYTLENNICKEEEKLFCKKGEK